MAAGLPASGTVLHCLLAPSSSSQQLLNSSTPGIFLNISPLVTSSGQAMGLAKSGPSPRGVGLLSAASTDGGSSLLLPLPDRLPGPGELQRLKAEAKAAQEKRGQVRPAACLLSTASLGEGVSMVWGC